MDKTLNKEKIRQAFSKHATSYDQYADIQKLVAEELITKIHHTDSSNILEIGCGTGLYTQLLQEKFPQANLVALDISEAMIKVAQKKLGNITFLTADGEDLHLDKKFDLICSNACFQWFENLSEALAKYHRALKSGGILLFSVFGPQTYQELQSVLSEFFKKEVAIAANSFINLTMLQKTINRHFKTSSIEEKTITKTHPSLKNLLNQIKFTGTAGAGLHAQAFIGPQSLIRLEALYKARFKSIVSTYQIFYCEAEK